jgi:hypothetical protein
VCLTMTTQPNLFLFLFLIQHNFHHAFELEIPVNGRTFKNIVYFDLSRSHNLMIVFFIACSNLPPLATYLILLFVVDLDKTPHFHFGHFVEIHEI